MASGIERLLNIMAALRDPEHGCPWDREQTFASIAPYTIEEAYEVSDAISRGDLEDLREELGDLLFQVVFYAQMASEAGAFGFSDIVAAISEKMLRRHPHVFGDETVADAAAQSTAWDAHKARERAKKAVKPDSTSILDGVARALPALMRAEKLQRRAARVGFDWERTEDVVEKVREELGEVQVELRQGSDGSRISAEMGDLLFSCVNLCRHAGLDAETALDNATAKFERRFRAVEYAVASRGGDIRSASLAEMDAIWEEVKAAENTASE